MPLSTSYTAFPLHFSPQLYYTPLLKYTYYYILHLKRSVIRGVSFLCTKRTICDIRDVKARGFVSGSQSTIILFSAQWSNFSKQQKYTFSHEKLEERPEEKLTSMVKSHNSLQRRVRDPFRKRKVRGGLARSSNANGKAHMSTNQYDCYVCNMMIIVFWKDKGLTLHNFFHDSYFSGLWKVDPLDDSTHLELSWAICGHMT